MSAATEPGWVRKLWPFLKRHKRHVLVAFGVAIAGQVITSLLPLVQRAIIDDTITTQTRPVAPLLVLLVGLAAVNFFFQYVRRYSGGRYGIDVQNDLRNALFERLQRLGVLELRYSHAHDLAAGARKLGDLRRRRRHVMGLRQRHRLDDHGRAPADLDPADPTAATYRRRLASVLY